MKDQEFNNIFPEIQVGFKLNSYDELFFEIFKNTKISCDLNIPNTLILEKGKPKLWLFNSNQNNQILQKKLSKVNDYQIMKFFLDLPDTNDPEQQKIFAIQSYLENQNDQKEVVYCRTFDNESFKYTKLQFFQIFANRKKINSIMLIQKVVDVKKSSNLPGDIYFCEYKRNIKQNPVQYTTIKKGFINKQEKQQHIEITCTTLNNFDQNYFKIYNQSLIKDLQKVELFQFLGD